MKTNPEKWNLRTMPKCGMGRIADTQKSEKRLRVSITIATMLQALTQMQETTSFRYPPSSSPNLILQSVGLTKFCNNRLNLLIKTRGKCYATTSISQAGMRHPNKPLKESEKQKKLITYSKSQL